MPAPISFAAFSLILSESHWHIQAGDADASLVVSALAEAMSLSPVRFPPEKGKKEQVRKLLVIVDPGLDGPSIGDGGSGPSFCLVPPPKNDDIIIIGMSLIGLTIARAELTRGGLLIHGALAAAPDHLGGGIILAGPGTVGKTTASERLPPTWTSLSDDSSLVVRNSKGQYWAHPWPTWSRFFSTEDGDPGQGGRWNVQKSLPLQAIFFLAQAKTDQIEPLSSAYAITYLTETVQHVSLIMARDLPDDQAQSLHEEQLAAAETLIHAVPSYSLHLSLTGTFWKNIEERLTPGTNTEALQPGHPPAISGREKLKKNRLQSFLVDDGILIVSYSGSSMNPTLRHPDLLEVLPYSGQPIQPGDVAYFHSPADDLKIIHRVVRVTAEGIRTRGDSNTGEDPFLLSREDIIGRVAAAWRNGKRRKISRGIRGKCSGYGAILWHRWSNALSYTLRGAYRALAASGLFRHLLPSSLQPRVFEFRQPCQQPSIHKVMIKGHVIGHYDDWKKLWVIKRPWRLIIDESKLPVVSESPSMDPPPLKNVIAEKPSA